MKKIILNSCLLILTYLFIMQGCFFPIYEPELIYKKDIRKLIDIKTPSRAYLLDGSIVIFEDGFKVLNDTVYGLGKRYWINQSEINNSNKIIPLDSIGTMTVFQDVTPESRNVANVSTTIFGAVLVPISIYCVSCPKCCFGSCPTVYTIDDNTYSFETELFSYSVSSLMEDKDLDVLNKKIPENGEYIIRITNEALEIHYINQLSLVVTKHPLNTNVYPTPEGNIVSIRNPIPPDEAYNSENKIITDKIRIADDVYYRSDTALVNKLKEGPFFDWIDIKTKAPQNVQSAKMLIRYRNTLLSTLLFYDVVLGSQGIKALEWNERMNSDLIYANQFKTIYKAFSGISINSFNGEKWIKNSMLYDAGPLNWKYCVQEIPVYNGEINIRLKFVPDNFMIDYIAFDFEQINADIQSLEIYPYEILDNDGNPRGEVIELLRNDDDNYLITNPGESYRLHYNIEKSNECEQTVFIDSKGYYTEWIRGSWLKNNNADFKFNLYDVQGTLAYLAKNWLENKNLLETEFFKTRVPVKEKLK